MATAELFDFRDPLPMPPGAARLVAAVIDSAPRVGLLLGLACGRTVPVTCTGVRRVSLIELATPDAVWTPLSCGLADPGLLLIPAEDAVALADLFLGGIGEGEARPCSPMEHDLLFRHTLPALRPLSAALSDHGVTNFQPGVPSAEPLPVGGGEVLAIPLDLELPSRKVARVTICLPAKSLLPSDTGPVTPSPSAAAQSVLGEVPVDVALRLSASNVSASDIEDLHPGDIIRLSTGSLDQLVGVLAGDGLEIPVLGASLGRRGTQRAIVVHAVTGGQ